MHVYAHTHTQFSTWQARNHSFRSLDHWLGEIDSNACEPLQDIVLLQRFILGVLQPFIAPPPLVKPTPLQYYCTAIAQYTPSYRPLFCMPYTIQYC